MTEITRLYWGPREAVVAEYAAFDPVTAGCVAPKQAKYLMLPYNGKGDFDPEWAASRKEMREAVRLLADSLEAHQGFRPEIVCV